MTKFSDLVGEHEFGLVPIMDLRHPMSSDATGVLFVLDQTTYLVFEDPSDGYRSNAGPILSYTGGAYELGYSDYGSRLHHLKEPVLCTHRTSGQYGGTDDVLEVRSKETGAVIFEVGTENVDDYYPGYHVRWLPENLSANTKSRLTEV